MIQYLKADSSFYDNNALFCQKVEAHLATLDFTVEVFCSSYGYELTFKSTIPDEKVTVLKLLKQVNREVHFIMRFRMKKHYFQNIHGSELVHLHFSPFLLCEDLSNNYQGELTFFRSRAWMIILLKQSQLS